MSLATALDRMIAHVAPRWGVQRALARERLRLLPQITRRAGWFEAAATSRRTAGWGKPGDANVPQQDLASLRRRSRALERESAWAEEANRVLRRNVIGPGIAVRPKDRSRGRTQRVLDRWIAFSGDGEFDPTGRSTWPSFLRLAMSTIVRDGEVLVQRITPPARLRADMSAPLQWKLLEADHLDLSKTGKLSSGNVVLQGVEYDGDGRRVAYWLYREHPESILPGTTVHSERMDAANFLHVFREDRPGQVRGVPTAAPCMVRMRDYASYLDAQMQRQILAATFSIIARGVDDATLPPIVEGKRESMPIEPGMITFLPYGADITVAAPAEVTGFREFAEISLREIAASYGVSYESLSRDYAKVNFSSARMGWLEMHREVQDWQEVIVHQLARPLWRWFTEALELSDGTAPVRATFTAAKREMIDPLKEGQAARDKIRNRMGSLSGALREQGVAEPREVLDELAEDLRYLQELGIGEGDLGGPAAGAAAGEEPDDEGGEDPDDGPEEGGAENALALRAALRTLGVRPGELAAALEAVPAGSRNGSGATVGRLLGALEGLD